MIEGAGITSSPCCPRRFHTICFVKYIVTLDFDPINCPCGNNLYTAHTIHESDSEDVTDILNNAEAREEIKRIKKKATDTNKKRLALTKLLSEKKQIFKETAAPHLTALDTIIKSEKAAIRQESVYKQYGNGHRTYVKARREFKRKYNLRWHGMRQIFGWPSAYSRINTCGNYMLSRIFRVRM